MIHRLVIAACLVATAVVAFLLAVVVVQLVEADGATSELPPRETAIPVLEPGERSAEGVADLELGDLALVSPYEPGAPGVPDPATVARPADGAGDEALPPPRWPGTGDGGPARHQLDLCALVDADGRERGGCPTASAPATVAVHQTYQAAQIGPLSGQVAAYPPLPRDEPSAPAPEMTTSMRPACEPSGELGARDVPVGITTTVPATLEVVATPLDGERRPVTTSVDDDGGDRFEPWQEWFDEATSGWFGWRTCFVLRDLEAERYRLTIEATDLFGRRTTLGAGNDAEVIAVTEDRDRPPTVASGASANHLVVSAHRRSAQRTAVEVFPIEAAPDPDAPLPCQLDDPADAPDLTGFGPPAEGGRVDEVALDTDLLQQPDYAWDPDYDLVDDHVHLLTEGTLHLVCVTWSEGDDVVARESFLATPPNLSLPTLAVAAAELPTHTIQPLTAALEHGDPSLGARWTPTDPASGDCAAADGADALTITVDRQQRTATYDEPRLLCDLREHAADVALLDPMRLVLRQPRRVGDAPPNADDDGDVDGSGPLLGAATAPWGPIARRCDGPCAEVEPTQVLVPVPQRGERGVESRFLRRLQLCAEAGIGCDLSPAALDELSPGLWVEVTWDDGPAVGGTAWRITPPTPSAAP